MDKESLKRESQPTKRELDGWDSHRKKEFIPCLNIFPYNEFIPRPPTRKYRHPLGSSLQGLIFK